MRKLIICLLLPISAFGDSCTDSAAQTISNSYEQVAARWSNAITSTMPAPNSSFGVGYYYVGTGVTPPSTVSIYRELGWDLDDISDPIGETDGISTNWYVRSLNGEPVTVGGSGPLSRSLTLSLNNSVNSLSGLSCGDSGSTNCCCAAEINSVVSVVQSSSGDIRNSIAVAVEQINSKMFTEINDVRRNQYALNSALTNGFNNVNANLNQLITLFNTSNSRLENIEDLLQNISEYDSSVGFDRVVQSIDNLKNSLALEVTQQSISGLLVTWTNYIKKLNDIENTLLSINANIVTISGDVQSIFGAVNRPEWMDTDFWPAIRDLQSSLSSNGVMSVDLGIVTNIYNGGIGSWSSMSNFWQGVIRYGDDIPSVGSYFASLLYTGTYGNEYWPIIYSNFKNDNIPIQNTVNLVNSLSGDGWSIWPAFDAIVAADILANRFFEKQQVSQVTNSVGDVDSKVDEMKTDFDAKLAETNKIKFSSTISDTLFANTNINLSIQTTDDFRVDLLDTHFVAAINGGADQEILNPNDFVITPNVGGFDFSNIMNNIRSALIILFSILLTVLFLVSIWGLLPDIIHAVAVIRRHFRYIIVGAYRFLKDLLDL